LARLFTIFPKMGIYSYGFAVCVTLCVPAVCVCVCVCGPVNVFVPQQFLSVRLVEEPQVVRVRGPRVKRVSRAQGVRAPI
jgi:hypothetical protein